MAKKLRDKVNNEYAHTSQIPRRKPGRPRNSEPPTRSISTSLTLLRTCAAALQAALAKPREPSTEKLVSEALAGLAERLGPAIRPDWKPGAPALPRNKATGFRLVLPDGTERVVTTLAAAAKVYGRKEASLAVMLSKGGGKCQRRSGESVVTCERVYEKLAR